MANASTLTSTSKTADGTASLQMNAAQQNKNVNGDSEKSNGGEERIVVDMYLSVCGCAAIRDCRYSHSGRSRFPEYDFVFLSSAPSVPSMRAWRTRSLSPFTHSRVSPRISEVRKPSHAPSRNGS